MEKVFCWQCGEWIEVDTDDYLDANEGDVFLTVRCPHCKAYNSIYYVLTTEFYAQKASEKEVAGVGEV